MTKNSQRNRSNNNNGNNNTTNISTNYSGSNDENQTNLPFEVNVKWLWLLVIQTMTLQM